MPQKSGGFKKFALSTLVAGAAGYIAGILTAPKSGAATRKDIKNTVDTGIAEAEKQLKNLHTELDRLLAEAKKQGKNATGKAKASYEEVTGKAGAAKDKARELISAIHEGEAEDRELQRAVTEAQKAIQHLKAYLKK